MLFEWDPAKAASNLLKHGVSFDVAKLVFDDPLHRSQPLVEGGEERWVTIGLAAGMVLLHVTHTVLEGDEGTEETVRIVSARKATSRERKAYEQGE